MYTTMLILGLLFELVCLSAADPIVINRELVVGTDLIVTTFADDVSISINWEIIAEGFPSLSTPQWVQPDACSENTYILVTDTTFRTLYKYDNGDNTVTRLSGFDGWGYGLGWNPSYDRDTIAMALRDDRGIGFYDLNDGSRLFLINETTNNNNNTFISCNDVTLDRNGNAYFTDLYLAGPVPETTIGENGVYSYIQGSNEVELESNPMYGCNGIGLSIDEKFLACGITMTMEIEDWLITNLSKNYEKENLNIYLWDHDESNGLLSNERIIYSAVDDIDFDEIWSRGSIIDGVDFDANGLLWITFFNEIFLDQDGASSKLVAIDIENEDEEYTEDSLGQAILTIEFNDITEFGAIFNVVYNQVDGYYYVTHGSIVGQFGYLSRFSLDVQYDSDDDKQHSSSSRSRSSSRSSNRN